MSDQQQNTIADRFEAYLLGQLDGPAMDQLEEELRQAPQQAEECLAVMKTLAMVREQFRDQREQAGELTKDPTLHGFHDLLSDLSAMEAAAEAEPVQWVGQINLHKPLWQQWQFVVPSGIAALLAIAVILIVALPNQNTATNNNTFTNNPIEPGPVGPALSDVVATLTAEHDAVWDYRPGKNLYAGQQFTLTQGFAEITTNRGAVVILQAPATIELLDNDNALQLHTGRLVGICETESSKGFLVRTPHMDVTDLGTRFGVDASNTGRTEVHVITGSVRIATKPSPGSDTVISDRELFAGQAFAAGVAKKPRLVAFDLNRFTLDASTTASQPRIMSGNAVWMGQLQGDLATGQREAAAIQVYAERQGHVLSEDAIVDMTASQTWPPLNGYAKQSIPAGTKVDVYLLHLDPPSSAQVKDVGYKAECIVRFDRPILAVIGAGTTLDTTDVHLGTPGTRYPINDTEIIDTGRRGIDAHMTTPDAIKIVEGGRAIRVDIKVGPHETALDQLRVVVASANEAKNP